MNAMVANRMGKFFPVLAVFWLMLAGSGWTADEIPLKSIAQLTVDDDARLLYYPSTVFYDRGEEEIYLVNGGTGRVVVYGPDFFPAVSIGVGRGVQAPRGGVVLPNGDVYLLQIRNTNSERPRITILNGAFFVEREIFLDTIPEAATFIPRELAVSRDGLIYLAGTSSRGVLVLDNEGTFLRRLLPLDQTNAIISAEEAPAASEADAEQEQLAVEAAEASGELPAAVLEPDEVIDPLEGERDGDLAKSGPVVDIPEEYLPRRGQQRSDSDPEEKLNPVKISHVTIDSNGRIYLLSGETSKVYVYGPDEQFLFSLGKKGGTVRYLSQPRALAIDEKRELVYVADYMRHSILAYSMVSGEYKFEFGGRGVGPGWFNFPEDIAINNQGQLIIADLFNRRVQVLEVDFNEFSEKQKKNLYGLKDELPDSSKPESEDAAVTEGQESTEGAEPLVVEEPVEEIGETVIEETITPPPNAESPVVDDQGNQ